MCTHVPVCFEVVLNEKVFELLVRVRMVQVIQAH